MTELQLLQATIDNETVLWKLDASYDRVKEMYSTAPDNLTQRVAMLLIIVLKKRIDKLNSTIKP